MRRISAKNEELSLLLFVVQVALPDTGVIFASTNGTVPLLVVVDVMVRCVFVGGDEGI